MTRLATCLCCGEEFAHTAGVYHAPKRCAECRLRWLVGAGKYGHRG